MATYDHFPFVQDFLRLCQAHNNRHTQMHDSRPRVTYQSVELGFAALLNERLLHAGGESLVQEKVRQKSGLCEHKPLG